MAASDDPRDPALEQTRSELDEGLKSCRAVVRNYRGLLAEDSVAPNPHPPADNDDTD